MADSQFNPLGLVTAPADWVLPSSLTLLLKNVYASYDGSGAGGSFVPCLQIISDSGHTVGSYPCATTVAAGASADVTWFPSIAVTPSGSGAASVVNVYGAGTSTYTKPAKLVGARVICIGSGGGGGSGCAGDAPAHNAGGAGGGGGSVTWADFQASDIPSSVTVRVAAGGAGGVGSGGSGANGSNGGATTFGALLAAYGGGFGGGVPGSQNNDHWGMGASTAESANGHNPPTASLGGGNAWGGQAANGNGTPGGGCTEWAGATGAGQNAGATGEKGGSSIFAGAAGGGGGDGSSPGGDGGLTAKYVKGGGAAGGSGDIGGAGANGTSLLGPFCGGGGGGGGGAFNLAPTAGHGGTGGIGCGGGGGGGADPPATTGGSGGSGGDGRCIVITFVGA